MLDSPTGVPRDQAEHADRMWQQGNEILRRRSRREFLKQGAKAILGAAVSSMGTALVESIMGGEKPTKTRKIAHSDEKKEHEKAVAILNPGIQLRTASVRQRSRTPRQHTSRLVERIKAGRIENAKRTEQRNKEIRAMEEWAEWNAKRAFLPKQHHLSKLRIMARRRFRTGKRRFKRRRTRYHWRRRRFRLKSKRRGGQPYIRKLLKTSTKPLVVEQTWPVAFQAGSYGKCAVVVPMYDYGDGTPAHGGVTGQSTWIGAGQGLNTSTTQQNWMSACVESPTNFSQMLTTAGFNINSQAVGSQKIIFGPRHYYWAFVNQELFPIKLKVYWCRPRRSYTVSGGFGSGGVDYISGTDINDMIARCFDRDKILVYNNNNPANPKMNNTLPYNFSPMQSVSFCSLFKVIKKKSFEMDAGECMNWKHSVKRYKVFSDYDWTMLTNEVCNRRTLFPVFVIQGCPVVDTNSLQAVSTGKASIALMFTQRTKIYQITATTQTYKALEMTCPGGLVVTAKYATKPVAAQIADDQ